MVFVGECGGENLWMGWKWGRWVFNEVVDIVDCLCGVELGWYVGFVGKLNV